MELERRRIATQSTLDLFRGSSFAWGDDDALTCVHVAYWHLWMMGHELPALPTLKSPLAAKRALAKRGWDSVEAMLDSLLDRISPAMMLLGDLAVVPGQDGLDAILVSAGPLKLMGWHAESGEFVLYDNALAEITGAWRV